MYLLTQNLLKQVTVVIVGVKSVINGGLLLGDNDSIMSNFIPLAHLSPDDEHRCGGSITLYKVSRRIHLVRETIQLNYAISIQDTPLLTNCAILSASGHGNSVNHLSDNLLKLYM